jgi:hypothetical protein
MTGFFPFHPLRLRRGLLVGAVMGLALTGWALLGAVGQTEPLGEARAGVSFGLALAFLYARFRLRPRPGWGLTLTPEGFQLSRPLSATPIQAPWTEVASARRLGPRPVAIAVLFSGDRRVLIPRHLFASEADFERAASALLAMTRSVEKTRNPTGIVQ